MRGVNDKSLFNKPAKTMLIPIDIWHIEERQEIEVGPWLFRRLEKMTIKIKIAT